MRKVIKQTRWTEAEWKRVEELAREDGLTISAFLRRAAFSTAHMRLKSVWQGVKSRCYVKDNPAYKDYGAKGVRLCDDWHDFKSFELWAIENGYYVGSHISRIDHSCNYSPENCKIESRSENCRDAVVRKNEKNGKPKSIETKSIYQQINLTKYQAELLYSILGDVYKNEGRKEKQNITSMIKKLRSAISRF